MKRGLVTTTTMIPPYRMFLHIIPWPKGLYYTVEVPQKQA